MKDKETTYSFDELKMKARVFYEREYPGTWRDYYYLFLGHLREIIKTEEYEG